MFDPTGRKPRSRSRWGCLAYLIPILLLAVGVVGAISVGNSPNYFPPAFVQQLSLPAFYLIGVGTIIVLVIVPAIFWRTPLRKPLGWLLGLVGLTFVAVVFLWLAFVPSYVSMTRTSFIPVSVDLSTGQTLHLQNAADGVTQILCIGVDQKCQPEHGAPGVLNQGIRLQPGQRVTITFDTAGEYTLTSETTPGMNLSVTVSPPDESSGA